MYAQVVQSDQVLRWNQFLPVSVEGATDIEPPPDVKTCPGAAAVHDLQMEQLKPDMFTAVSEPIKVFRSVLEFVLVPLF